MRLLGQFRWWAVGLAGLGLLGGLVFWWWMGRVDMITIGPDVTLRQVIIDDQPATTAALIMAFTRDRNNYSFMNVAIDFNHDNQIAAYQVGDVIQEEWLVANAPARVRSEEGSSFSFRLADLSLASGKDWLAQVVLSRSQQLRWPEKLGRWMAWRQTQISHLERQDVRDRLELDPAGLGTTGVALAEEVMPAVDDNPPDRPEGDVDVVISDGSMGEAVGASPKPKEKVIYTQSKEFDVFHDGVPDADQGKNECVPTSVANSLRWLAKTNNFTAKLPLSNKELLEELKDDFKWQEASGVVVTDNFLGGKEAFVKRHNLPLETHQVGNMFDSNFMAKIAVELQKGQDVELDLEYAKKNADGTYTRIGGHMVTAVGTTGRRDGTQYVDIHDPASPGPSKLDRYQVKGNRVVNYQYQGAYLTYIRYAIAESPIEPPATKLPDSASPASPQITVTENINPVVTSSASSSPTVTTSSVVTPVSSASASPSSSPSATQVASSSPSPTTTTASPTPTQTTASPTPTPTPTQTNPVISGYYEPYTGNADNGYVNDINVKITPTDLAGQTINGVRIDLAGQGLPSPYSSDHKINATAWFSQGGSQDWNCSMGITVACQGTTALTINNKSIFAFFFTGSLASAPANLTVQLLNNGTVMTTVNLSNQGS